MRTSARLFAKNGYHATGMAELCDAAGIGRGTMYYYVDGKEDLLYEICRAEVVKMNQQAAEIAAMAIPSDERLRLLARGLMVNIAGHLNEWTVFFKEFGGLTAARRAHIIAARHEYEGRWLQVLNEGVDAGLFRSAGPLVVKGLLGMFNYTYLWFRPKGEVSPEQIADSFL
ncbi:MAG: TetR/AcrR family transcriptional regulator, partial [Hyphomicrobiales bacterium]